MQAQSAHIAESAALLAAGGVVAFPTETVYGLGADALNPAAVARVFEIKGRPSNNPLIVHVDGPAMAKGLVAEWPEAAQRLAEAFWPGPLSIVLPKSAAVPSIVTAGGPNVALRAPDHPVALALIRALGRPIVGPSANPSGSVSPTTVDHVRSAFGERVPVLDGGPCTRGIESTVISLVGEPRVLRPGLISAAQLSQVLGKPVTDSPAEHAAVDSDVPMESPGMLSKHYAPTTPAERFTGDQWPLLRRELASRAREVVVLSHLDRRVDSPHTFMSMPRDPEQYAARLYAALREADELQASLIAIEVPDGQRDQDPTWRAIHDRLNRATVAMLTTHVGARDQALLEILSRDRKEESLDESIARYREMRRSISAQDLVPLLQQEPYLVRDWIEYCDNKRTTGGWYVLESGEVGNLTTGKSMQFDSLPWAVAEFVLLELDSMAALGGKRTPKSKKSSVLPALDPGGVSVNSRGRSPRNGAERNSTPEGSA
ncbi:MAG: L-threonylcarbamoyladenylate synthase [Planctomycetota bacterium]